MNKINCVVAVLMVLSIILSSNAVACSCADEFFLNINNRFDSADGVYMLKIEKTYDSANADSGFHYSDVRVLEAYKGELINKVKVYGNRGFGIIACGTSLSEGEIYFVFTSKEKGEHTTGLCSRNLLFEEYVRIWGEDELKKADYSMLLEVLAQLQKHADYATTTKRFYVGMFDLIVALQQKKPPEENFGLYGITIDSSLIITKVEILKSIDPKFSDEIMKGLEKKEVVALSYNTEKKKLETDGTRFTVGIFYDEEKGYINPMFLREFVIYTEEH